LNDQGTILVNCKISWTRTDFSDAILRHITVASDKPFDYFPTVIS
jgi:hypothetical protein